MDMGLFWLLTQVGMASFWANLVGATSAVIFVFFSSLRPVFSYAGDKTHMKLMQYLAYQSAAIPAASWAISTLHYTWPMHAPIWAKVFVTPFTFMCNYLFMKQLSRNPSV
jgi:putative flippase GtrA